ncbi:lipoyl(octanoyl) transferase LipB [Ruania alkalisoli]|uniref:Octanoyltransferase n=1 Tax=Ruania alkalisoli TaxID=2779775 RepID=A0A7M1SQU5_9MICO|nr:lipoyl(octanoyl) transferase LipB [Ruania alkalisoli]QOR69172.1 lipoyl(octanoyl) transferase LipB [Ruania alkalisoli]
MRTYRWDLGARLIPYREAWQYQRDVHASVVAGGEDELILVEHEPVYTAGRRTASWDRPGPGVDVVDVDRGGRITWHGPGQLVVYPIARLAAPIDVVAYVRALEQAVIDALLQWGVHGDRVEGRSGVWVLGDDGEQDRKVAAIGVRVARGVTMHGLALNVCPDLSAFGSIVPCGINDAGVTSVTELTGSPLRVAACAGVLEPHLRRRLAPLLDRPSVGPGEGDRHEPDRSEPVHA